MLGSTYGAAESCSPGQGISSSAQLGEGDGGKGTPGKEQGSSIEGVSTSLGKRKISLLWF